jgi:hypothetical protein
MRFHTGPNPSGLGSPGDIVCVVVDVVNIDNTKNSRDTEPIRERDTMLVNMFDNSAADIC